MITHTYIKVSSIPSGNNIPTCEDIIFIHPCEDIVIDNISVLYS